MSLLVNHFKNLLESYAKKEKADKELWFGSLETITKSISVDDGGEHIFSRLSQQCSDKNHSVLARWKDTSHLWSNHPTDTSQCPFEDRCRQADAVELLDCFGRVPGGWLACEGSQSCPADAHSVGGREGTIAGLELLGGYLAESWGEAKRYVPSLQLYFMTFLIVLFLRLWSWDSNIHCRMRRRWQWRCSWWMSPTQSSGRGPSRENRRVVTCQ